MLFEMCNSYNYRNSLHELWKAQFESLQQPDGQGSSSFRDEAPKTIGWVQCKSSQKKQTIYYWRACFLIWL